MPNDLKQSTKKVIFLILFAVILVGIIAIVIFTLTTPWLGKWKTYENSRYNFSLKYPSNWKLGEAPTNNDGRTFISPQAEVECWAYGFANALSNESGEPQNLDEFVNFLTSDGETEIVKKDQTKLSGNRAIRLLTKETDTVTDMVYALGKETGYGFACTFDNIDSQQDFEPTFKEMLESFLINSNLDGEN